MSLFLLLWCSCNIQFLLLSILFAQEQKLNQSSSQKYVMKKETKKGYCISKDTVHSSPTPLPLHSSAPGLSLHISHNKSDRSRHIALSRLATRAC